MEIVVQYSKIAALSVALSGAALSTNAIASDQDLGVLGPTWKIVEPDMRLAIVAEAHGVDWDAINERMTGQAQNHTQDIPDWFVPVAEHTETNFIDPSYTLGEDIEALKRQPDGSYQWGSFMRPVPRSTPRAHTA